MNKSTKFLLSAMIVSLSAPIIQSQYCFANNNTEIAKIEQDLTLSKRQEIYNGWIIADCVNIREEPTTTSQILGHLYFNEKHSFICKNENWVQILKEGKCIGYINKKYISANEPFHKTYNVPYTCGKKTYMPYKILKNGKYKSIFSSNSKQYNLQNYCHTGRYGIRQYKDRFCVALGSAFDISIGQYFDLYLENGKIIPCIMSDQKSDDHTDISNIITLQNGCMSEFIVDTQNLNSKAKIMGDISYCCDLWQSRVVKVIAYDKNIEL